MAKTHPILKVLREATRGLAYPSETDAGFEPFVWDGADRPPTAADVLDRAGAAAGTPVEEGTLTDFFRAVPRSARGEFLGLAAALADHLDGVKVFKVGAVSRAAYVVGRTTDGKWAGVKTDLVET